MATHLDTVKTGLSNALRELPPKLKTYVYFSVQATVKIATPTSPQVQYCSILISRYLLAWDNDTRNHGNCNGSTWLDAVPYSSGRELFTGRFKSNSYSIILIREKWFIILSSIVPALRNGFFYFVQMVLRLGSACGVYLVSDGSSNHTQEFLLSQLSGLRELYGSRWTVHTITPHTNEGSEGRGFLTQLAHRTGGRYHVAMATTTSPLLGDDMNLLNKEIKKLNKHLTNAKELL